MADSTKPSESIHPRVIRGRTMFEKSNTAKPPKNPLTGTLRKVTKRLQERRHGRDISIENLKKSNSAIDWDKAYHVPGSMKP